MRHVWHAWIAPELLQLRGIARNNNLAVALRQVLSISFPFSFREGEAATFVAHDDDLNVAATLRTRQVQLKSQLVVLPGQLGQPTGGEPDAAAWASALGGAELERVIRACFAQQPLGAPVAFDPQVIRLDPQSDAYLIQQLQDEVDALRRALAAVTGQAQPFDADAADALRDAVRRYPFIRRDIGACRGVLADVFAGRWRRERHALLVAHEQGVADEVERATLASNGAGASPALIRGRLVSRLLTETALSQAAAEWAVQAWLDA